MRIGIVGAGPAGSYAARLLAQAGNTVSLFDPRAPWEKPCGGGLTPQVLLEFPELENHPLERCPVSEVAFLGPDGKRALLHMSRAWITVSRRELSRVMLAEAQAAGVEFIGRRVRAAKAQGSGWSLETAAGAVAVDYLVGADGATGLVRRSVAGKWRPDDLCLCYGYLLPAGSPPTLAVRFFADMLGYAWIFPRPGGLFSAGIAAGGSALGREALTARLRDWVRAEFKLAGVPAPEFGKPYGALLPSLSAAGYAGAQVEGKNWALVGDASGAVDPVTGEGIYYALKTARLLAESLGDPAGGSYAERWRAMAGPHIGHAASHRWRERFYRGWVLWLYALSVRRSPFVRRTTEELMSGLQPYSGLKQRLRAAAPRIAAEALLPRKGVRPRL